MRITLAGYGMAKRLTQPVFPPASRSFINDRLTAAMQWQVAKLRASLEKLAAANAIMAAESRDAVSQNFDRWDIPRHAYEPFDSFHIRLYRRNDFVVCDELLWPEPTTVLGSAAR